MRPRAPSGLKARRSTATTAIRVGEIPRRSDLHDAGPRVHSSHVTLIRSSTLPKEETRTELALEGIWRVVVLNDPVNLMSYVVMVFKKVFGFDEQTARQKMLEVHEQGRSIVWSGLREKAEAYVFTLQQWHLTAVLESDEAH
jgi:ATP-dependent Clp protease adaptor protein ClpS